MNQIGKRIKISGLEIQIASPNNIFMLIFLPIWFTGWTVGGIATISHVVSGKAGEELLFMLIWLCMWLVAELFVLYVFLWGVFGREIISIQHGNLEIKRSILGHGPSKKFQISKIKNLRAAGFFASMMSWSLNMSYWGISGGTVAFDYDGKTKRFGLHLNEADANQLVNNLKTKIIL